METVPGIPGRRGAASGASEAVGGNGSYNELFSLRARNTLFFGIKQLPNVFNLGFLSLFNLGNYLGRRKERKKARRKESLSA